MFRIIALGDNNIDFYEDSGVSYPGGNCPNVAAYAALCGYPSAYIGTVGNDRQGDVFRDGLSGAGVDLSHLRAAEGRTSYARVRVEGGDRKFSGYDRSIIDANPLCFDTGDLAFIRTFDLIHSSIYSEFSEGEFDRLRELNIPISYDFSVEWSREHMECLDEAYLSELKPVAEDFLSSMCAKIDYVFLSCSHISEAETERVLKQCVEYGCKAAIGTRGLEGSLAFDGHAIYRQKAYRTSVVDTLGAGDSFLTRFLLTYFDGIRLLDSCRGSFQNDGYDERDIAEYHQKLMEDALSQAALFAAYSCQTEGAFGFGQII